MGNASRQNDLLILIGLTYFVFNRPKLRKENHSPLTRMMYGAMFCSGRLSVSREHGLLITQVAQIFNLPTGVSVSLLGYTGCEFPSPLPSSRGEGEPLSVSLRNVGHLNFRESATATPSPLGLVITLILSTARSAWHRVPARKPCKGVLFIATPRTEDAKPRRGDLSKAAEFVALCDRVKQSCCNRL